MKHAEQFLVKLGDGSREDVMTYNSIIDILLKQMEAESQEAEDERVFIFKSIDAHRKVGNTFEVMVSWEDGSKTWEPLGLLAKSDPVTLEKHDLLRIPGWKCFRYYTKSKKKLNRRMLKQVRLNAMKYTPRYKFGVRIPRDVAEAKRFDEKNNNKLWYTAIKAEMDQILEYETFKSAGIGRKSPRGYQQIRLHIVFDVKHDLRHRARLIAGGHMTEVPKDSTYSLVASLRSIRIVTFIAESNQLDLCAGDVRNAYLEAYTKEKVCCIAGPEFAEYGLQGHLLIIVKALYGLKSSGARFHEKFADSLARL